MSFNDAFTAKYGTARISESISFSDSVQIERSPHPPNLYALPAENKVTLAWTKQNDSTVAQITDYIIEHSNDNGNTWTAIDDPVSTTRAYTVEPGKHAATITNGQETLFRVAAVNSFGTGPFSTVQDATPESDDNLIVTNVSVTQGPEKIMITWDPNALYITDINDYLVYRSNSPDGPWTLHDDGYGSSETSLTIDGITKFEPTFVKIKAALESKNGCGANEESQIAWALPEKQTPRKIPSNDIFSFPEKLSVTLEWEEPRFWRCRSYVV